MMARHPLGTTLGNRCMLAFAENKPGSMRDFEELMEEMAQGCSQTRIVEDVIGSRKNSRTVRNFTKGKEARGLHEHGAGTEDFGTVAQVHSH